MHVDEALSRGVLDVVAVGGASGARHGATELVVDLGPWERQEAKGEAG